MIDFLTGISWLSVIVTPFVVITAWLCWELEKAYGQ